MQFDVQVERKVSSVASDRSAGADIYVAIKDALLLELGVPMEDDVAIEDAVTIDDGIIMKRIVAIEYSMIEDAAPAEVHVAIDNSGCGEQRVMEGAVAVDDAAVVDLVGLRRFRIPPFQSRRS